jgi:hypothetical protein
MDEADSNFYFKKSIETILAQAAAIDAERQAAYDRAHALGEQATALRQAAADIAYGLIDAGLIKRASEVTA